MEKRHQAVKVSRIIRDVESTEVKAFLYGLCRLRSNVHR